MVYSVSIFIYRIIIDISYYIAVSPLYSDVGMVICQEDLFSRMTTSYLLTIILCTVNPSSKNRIVSVYLNLQLIIMLIPLLSYYAFAKQSINYVLIVVFVHIMQIFIYKILYAKKYSKVKSSESGLERIFKAIMCLIVLVSVYISYKYARFPSFDVLDFNKIYHVRESISVPNWSGYLIAWTTSIIIPFMFCSTFLAKKYKKTLFYGALQFLFYLIYANKYILLIIPSVIVVCAIYKTKYFYIWITGGVSMLSLMFAFVHKYSGVVMPVAILPNRLLYIPAQIKFAYYNFFVNNKKVFFADGLIGRIFSLKSPYEYAIPEQISLYMFEISEPYNTNTGYLADSYANAGLIGLLVISFLLIVCLYIVDRISYGIDRSLVIGSSFFIMMSLNDGAFFTICLTNGGLLLFFIYLSLKKELFYINNE